MAVTAPSNATADVPPRTGATPKSSFDIGLGRSRDRVQGGLEADLARVGRACGQPEPERAPRGVDAARELERPEQRFGLSVAFETRHGEAGVRRLVQEGDGSVVDREMAEAHAVRVGRAKVGEPDRTIPGDRQHNVRARQFGIDETDFAVQQGRQGEFEIDPVGRHGPVAGLAARNRELLHPQDGTRQKFQVDRPFHRDVGIEQAGEPRLDLVPVRVPVDEIRSDERGRQDHDQQDGKDGQAFAQGLDRLEKLGRRMPL